MIKAIPLYRCDTWQPYTQHVLSPDPSNDEILSPLWKYLTFDLWKRKKKENRKSKTKYEYIRICKYTFYIYSKLFVNISKFQNKINFYKSSKFFQWFFLWYLSANLNQTPRKTSRYSLSKKIRKEVTGTEKRIFLNLKMFKKLTYLGPVTSIWIFLQFSQKCDFIDPCGNFVFYEIFCSSNF